MFESNPNTKDTVFVLSEEADTEYFLNYIRYKIKVDIALYGNAMLSIQDKAILFLDPSKHRIKYTKEE